MELIPELISKPAIAFTAHISEAGNNKIVFSGKFGTGKTTFLREYFNEESKYNNSKYQCFHLFPISYSIASNEDIIELIKYDLILEILRKNISVEDEDIDVTYFFLKKHYQKIFSTILFMIPKVGKDLSEYLDKVLELKGKFEEYKKEVNEKINEGDVMVNFLESLENQKGSAVENSLLSKTIEKVLSRNKERTEKENVLIIDDLDRIDPEHIFRILNVFSAHFDTNYQGNKFGFDKIIIVCDIENVRKIFANKYGQDVDFSGYIDKFYSLSIFNFDNRALLESIIAGKLSNIQIVDRWKSAFGNGRFYKEYIPSSYYRITLKFLSTLVYNGLLPLRRILNTGFYINVSDPEKLQYNGVVINYLLQPELWLISVIVHFCGSFDDILDKIRILTKRNIEFDLMQEFAGIVYWIGARSAHSFQFKNDEKYSLLIASQQVLLTPVGKSDETRKISIIMNVPAPGMEYHVSFADFYHQLSQVLEYMKTISFIQ